jgi:hypothetical protein
MGSIGECFRRFRTQLRLLRDRKASVEVVALVFPSVIAQMFVGLVLLGLLFPNLAAAQNAYQAIIGNPVGDPG